MSAIYGTSGNDTLTGGSGADIIFARGGTDRVTAGAGNDTVQVERSVTGVLQGGDGVDQLLVGAPATLAGASIDGFEVLAVNSFYSFEWWSSNTVLTAAQFASFGVIQSGNGGLYQLTGADAGLYDLSARPITSLARLNGSAGADTLRGSANGDDLHGQGGNDVIEGLSGNDSLGGGSGSDTIRGGDGSDHLFGNPGDDFLNGDNGDDFLAGDHGEVNKFLNSGSDTLLGGNGADWVEANSGSDLVIAGTGNDTVEVLASVTGVLQGGEGIDRLFVNGYATLSGASIDGFEVLAVSSLSSSWLGYNTVLTASQFASFGIIQSGNGGLYQLTGADAGLYDLSVRTVTSLGLLNGSSGIDTLRGDTNGNWLEGQNGHDVIEGLGGDDRLGGGNGNDSIFGGDGRDTLTGGAGDDWLDGGEGDDYVFGDFGNDTILLSSQAVEFLDGGAGSDLLLITNGTSLLPSVTLVGIENIVKAGGGSGSLTLTASQVSSVISIGGFDSITGSTSGRYDFSQTFVNSPGNFSFGGSSGIDTIIGDSRSNYFDARDGSDVIESGEGNDTLIGGNGNDFLAGEGGNDSLIGGADNDTLIGGTGADSMLGGDGSDLLDAGSNDGIDSVNAGSGNDTVLVGGAATDTLIGGDGIDLLAAIQADITGVTASGFESLVVSTNVRLTRAQFVGFGSITSYNGGLYDIYGADAGLYDLSTRPTTGLRVLFGSAGIDTLRGDSLSNWLEGQDGNDSLDGGLGNDTLGGGVGDDRALGGNGNDWLVGGTGNDLLDAGLGDDTLAGDAGFETLTGGTGNDSINGGADTDLLSYAELTAANQAITVSLTTLRATGAAGNDTLALVEDVLAGAGSDSVYGDSLANRLFGAAGQDTLLGAGGNDLIDGGAGTDFVSYFELTAASQAVTVDLVALRATGAAGNDTLAGIENILTGAGNDRLVGDGLANLLLSTSGNDTILAGGGDDTFIGGFGEDSIDGGGAVDLLSYADLLSATQAVTVDLVALRSTGAAGNDTLAGIENVLTGAGNDSVLGDSLANMISTGGGNDTLLAGGANDTVLGGFGEDSIDGGTGSDLLSYADLASATQGVTVDLVLLRTTGAAGNDTFMGIENVVTGAGNDRVLGDGLANVLSSGSGNDTILGADGNDTLNGELGADCIDGGAGVDLLSYADLLSSAQAVTVDLFSLRATGAAGNDTLAGIENVLTGSGNDSLTGDGLANHLSSSSGNDTIRGGEGNDTLDGGAGVDLLSYADLSLPTQSVTVDLAALLVSGVAGTDLAAGFERVLTGAGSDFLAGDGLANELNSSGGDDTLLAAGGSDTVIGGLGDDFIDGGAGVDLLSYADLTLAGQAVTIDLVSLRVMGAAGNDTLSGIENVTTGAGDDSVLGDGMANLLFSGTGNDTLVTGDGNDTLVGGGGNDLLISDNGNDSILESGGSSTVLGGGGADTIALAAGSDSVLAGDGNDRVVFAGAGSVTILGGNGADFMQGGEGNDVITEAIADDAGNDTLLGGGGRDTMIGAAGADSIVSGADNDRLVGGGGHDTLDGGTGTDQFVFESAIGIDNIDRVQNYAVVDDTIILDNSVFTTLTEGVLSAGAFQIGSAASDTDDRIIFNNSTGALFYDTDGVGGVAAVQFATITGITGVISNTEFLVI